MDAGRIQITLVGDKVKLEGEVRALYERDIIEQAVWAAPGVASVEDRVSVGA